MGAIAALALFAAVWLSACAPIPQESGSARPSPPSSPPVTARPGTIPAAAPAFADTTPSAEARQVLESIPEPLRPGERVPPPLAPPYATSPPPDTTMGSTVDSVSSDVPVPTPTFPLGQNPPADTTARAETPSAPSPSPTAPPAAPPPPRAEVPRTVVEPPPPPEPDSCWRLQVGAPAIRAKAQSIRDAAESQLLVPMVIEIEKRLFKVRTRDCWDHAAADRLKQRALASGFSGAFLFEKPKP